jgi:hypothetical protein
VGALLLSEMLVSDSQSHGKASQKTEFFVVTFVRTSYTSQYVEGHKKLKEQEQEGAFHSVTLRKCVSVARDICWLSGLCLTS